MKGSAVRIRASAPRKDPQNAGLFFDRASGGPGAARLAGGARPAAGTPGVDDRLGGEGGVDVEVEGQALRTHRCRAERAHLPRPLERGGARRSEEHTSELQSQSNLVCRLLLEKKKMRN